MKRKDIIVISVFANMGLIAILLIGSLNGKKEINENFVVSQEKKEEVAEIEVPKIKEEDIVYKLPKIEIKEKDFFEVVIKKGDSLEKIAKENFTSVDELLKINNLANSFLQIDQIILVPKIDGKKEVVFEKKEEKKESQFYIVKSGDNPWTIAMKHHMKVEDLLKINDLDENKARRLRPGDKLLIR